METRCRSDPACNRVRLFAEFREGNSSLVCWVGVGLHRGLCLRHRRDRVESQRRGTSLSGLWTQGPLEVFSGAQHLPELRRAALILSTSERHSYNGESDESLGRGTSVNWMKFPPPGVCRGFRLREH